MNLRPLPTTEQPVGLVGLGLLGSALGGRLLAAGFPVIGFDTDPAARERFVAAGGQVVGEAVRLAASCRRLFLSLPNSEHVAEVGRQLRPELQHGAILLDTTTGDPAAVEGLAQELAPLGIAFLDCEVGGSSRQVATGQAILLCGGDETAFRACADLLGVISEKVFHLGPAGMGTRMKLALNIAIGLHRAVLAESLAFAQAAGIAGDKALAVLAAGPGYSKAMDSKGPKMLAGDFAPEARLAQHLKDVRQILATGQTVGARLPLSALHAALLAEAVEAGWGGEDNAAIYRLFLRG